MPENLLLPTPLRLPKPTPPCVNDTDSGKTILTPPFLLGRFIAHPLSPLDNYRPLRIPTDSRLSTGGLERRSTFESLLANFYAQPSISTNVSQLVTSATSATTKAKISGLLGLSTSSATETKAVIKASRIKTWGIEQYGALFKSLLWEVSGLKEELAALAADGKTDNLYWAIGVKTVEGPSLITTSSTASSSVHTQGTVPLGQFAPPLAASNVGDINLGSDRSKSTSSDFSGVLSADSEKEEYIVAMRYVKVKLRRFITSSSGNVSSAAEARGKNLGRELLKKGLVMGQVVDFGGRKGHYSFGDMGRSLVSFEGGFYEETGSDEEEAMEVVESLEEEVIEVVESAEETNEGYVELELEAVETKDGGGMEDDGWLF